MKHLYESCMICPRNCGVNRLSGVNGFCGETSSLRAASAVIHRGEEPPITGAGGSGTIFISGCNLGCSFCQNYQISHNNTAAQKPVQSLGREITSEEFALICAALCAKGAENINIVTGSHAVPAIIKGIEAAKKKNVNIPFLWNSSGYDSVNSLELLKNYIDIFLPDIKTLDCKIAEKYFNAPDYPETAKAAVLKMIDITRQKQRGSDKSKVIIRHLVLPGHLESTRSVLRWFADNAKDRALLSVMTQYTPVNCNSEQLPAAKLPAQGYLSARELDTVLGWLDEYEIDDGFCQELVTGSAWLPDFRRDNPFSSELSVPVWHA